jgi:hypothetical protein
VSFGATFMEFRSFIEEIWPKQCEWRHCFCLQIFPHATTSLKRTINPTTNLHSAFRTPSKYPPWVEGQTSHDHWDTPRLHYIDPTPPHLIPKHRRDLLHPEPTTLQIYIASAPGNPHVTIYLSSSAIHGTTRGLTQMQAHAKQSTRPLLISSPTMPMT